MYLVATCVTTEKLAEILEQGCCFGNDLFLLVFFNLTCNLKYSFYN